MALSPPPRPGVHWFSILASALDRRSAPRLAKLLLGAVLARGRRTVTSWIRAVGLSPEFRPCYTTVAAAGKRADAIAARLVAEVVQPLVASDSRVTLAIDDTPTERYGPHVQGAGVHHNPSPGPAGSPYVYGHVWVVLAVLGYHDRWRLEMSDRTCTGLQLVNFWQDIGCDLRERGRVYLPVESMARFDVSERDLDRPIASPAVRALVAEQVGIARDLLVAGEPLHRFVPARVALDLRMFSIAGLALCNAIARQGHDTLARRPAPGVRGRVLIAATAIRLLARGAR